MDFWCQLLEAEFLQDINKLWAKAQHKIVNFCSCFFYNLKKEILVNVCTYTIVQPWTRTICRLN